MVTYLFKIVAHSSDGAHFESTLKVAEPEAVKLHRYFSKLNTLPMEPRDEAVLAGERKRCGYCGCQALRFDMVPVEEDGGLLMCADCLREGEEG